MPTCAFCGQPVKPNASDTWRQVTVWVGGKKLNGATLQGVETLAFAHGLCVKLAKDRRISPGQGALL